MDVGIPSNLERFTGDPGIEFEAGFADDEQIMRTIANVDQAHGYLLDPHTATAWFVGSDNIIDRPQVVVATAHPAKFSSVVEASVGRTPEPPPGFEDLSTRAEHTIRITTDPSDLEPLLR
jgi:threonine synthase